MAEVFLMEDSNMLRRVLVEELRGAGHNVTSFPDGSDSDDAPLLANADILVTDLCMPNVGGIDVINNVRSAYPDLPIIVITGRSPETLTGLPVDRVIHKPVSGYDLLEHIRTLTTAV